MTETANQTISLESLLKNSKEGFPLNSKYILELPIFNPENGFPFMREYFENICAHRHEKFPDRKSVEYKIQLIKTAQKLSPDILGLKFNIESVNEIPEAVKLLEKLTPHITLPLMLHGCGNDEIDRELLPELATSVSTVSIIASANENTYKKIIPAAKTSHFIVLKSPIDINLAKELNILSSKLGQPLDKIIIDTDIGGLGYGFEYGYSIIEKIKQEALKDKYLDMPIVSFAGEEALKTKEAKSEDFSKSRGPLKERRILLEITAANAIRAAGANLIVLNQPEALKTLKGIK